LIDASSNQTRKALVSLAIETVLHEISKSALDKVTSKLYKDYKCYLPDCYENPEYLKTILQDLYGKCSGSIIESIKNNLKDMETQKGIDAFIAGISV
jgi:hypothetical protein